VNHSVYYMDFLHMSYLIAKSIGSMIMVGNTRVQSWKCFVTMNRSENKD
jgi:hypothetical protein